jgi:hypothetical protein
VWQKQERKNSAILVTTSEGTGHKKQKLFVTLDEIEPKSFLTYDSNPYAKHRIVN